MATKKDEKPRRKRIDIKGKISEALDPIKKSAAKARAKLREAEGRRMVEAGEVLVGGVAAGAAHGMGIDLEIGGDSYPMGLPVGVGLVVAGVAMGQPDLQALGLGATTYGAGRVAEDMVRNAAK